MRLLRVHCTLWASLPFVCYQSAEGLAGGDARPGRAERDDRVAGNALGTMPAGCPG